MLRDADGTKRLKGFKDRGFVDSLSFTVDGEQASFETVGEDIDVIRIRLPKALASGSKAIIRTPFFVDLPGYISRSGHIGQNYMICQWFPKPAVYDRKGWHTFPYLDQGEFYSDFGSYDVTITLPSDYIVGATGVLQNAGEQEQYKAMGIANVKAGSRKNTIAYKAAAPTKSLNYKGERIPDFAWFAAKDFVVRYDTLQVENRVVDVFTYHHPDGNENWTKSTDYVKSGARAYSGYLGAYPYPVVQAVEGPKNESSGGMEYPMITLITSPEATPELLDVVLTHEVGHNWFMGILGSNERQHAWMDEGLNTYFEFRYEADKYRYNMLLGSAIPESLKKLPLSQFQSTIYKAINDNLPMDPAIDQPSASYASKEEYGIVSYFKTAIWVYLMELQLGKENVDRAFRAYYDQWKFRHPYPEDMKGVFEKEIGKDLTEYFDLLKKKGSL